MADETATITLNGQSFTAVRAPFGVRRKLGKELNLMEAAFFAGRNADTVAPVLDAAGQVDAEKTKEAQVNADWQKLKHTLRDTPGFYDAAYAVIAAYCKADDGMSAGVIQGICDAALDENKMQAEIFNALTTIQKLTYPESFVEKKADPAP